MASEPLISTSPPSALPPPPLPAKPESTFRNGLRAQAKVIGALIMRELHTRYGRENIGYVWLILEPMLLAVAISILHSRTPTPFGSDMKPVPFALTGYCCYIMFRGIFNRSEGALEANLPLLYHRNVGVFDIMLSRALLEGAATFFAFAFLMGLAVSLGMANLPYRPGFLLLGFSWMLVFSFALSLVVVALTHENRSAGRLVHPIGYILLPLSGAFWAMQWLPTAYSDIFWYVPLSHIIEIARYGQFRSAVPDFIDWLYLTGWTLGTMLLGLLGIAALRPKIHMP